MLEVLYSCNRFTHDLLLQLKQLQQSYAYRSINPEVPVLPELSSGSDSNEVKDLLESRILSHPIQEQCCLPSSVSGFTIST